MMIVYMRPLFAVSAFGAGADLTGRELQTVTDPVVLPDVSSGVTSCSPSVHIFAVTIQ